MADRYLIETSATDGYLLEDSSGVLILEQQAGTFVMIGQRKLIHELSPAVSPSGPIITGL